MWPFGSDKTADEKAKDIAGAKAAEAQARVAAAAAEKVAPPAAKDASAKADTGGSWWWPFGDKKEAVKAVPKIDPKVTQAWLDSYEPRLREAIKDSKFELERRENVLVITAPVDSSFNPDRPAMLLPITLGPITRVAKIIETDSKTAVLVLGHADTSGAGPVNQKLSQERAQSIAAIFRLSGLERNRLSLRGMGSVMPRAANDSLQGRALNRRVEMLVTPQDTMLALLNQYKQPTPSAAELVAAQDTKLVAKTPEKAAVKATGKASASKKASSAKKAAPAKATVAKKSATPAKASAKKATETKKVATTDKTN